MENKQAKPKKKRTKSMKFDVETLKVFSLRKISDKYFDDSKKVCTFASIFAN